MTEQPKFQRRKRRGAEEAVARPQRAASAPPDPSIAELEALIAEKEALLQRKAELEAKRLREAERARVTEAAAEQARQAKAMRDAEVHAKLKARQAELDAQRKRDAEKAKLAENERATKPRAPLVLTRGPEPKPKPAPVFDPEASWKAIDRFPLDAQRLAQRNVITALRTDPSHTRFDILRTRMLQALSENGWKRVAITSPTKDCGKTFTAANLAISLSRQENCRTVLLDFDMRSPSLHKIFGVSDTGAIGDMLRGEIAPDAHLQGFAPNSIAAGSHVAIGFNGIVEPYAAELLQDPSTKTVLEDIETQFQPDVMLFDLPPALLNDDVIAMRPHIDALLIVAAGGLTKANDIKETERRIGENIPLLGVVLNKSEHIEAGDYSY
ncbi:MAG: P-loop NTPase [Pelagibaca sp.]